MTDLTLLRGLPGAGKTTLAKTLVGPETVRVNKDTIREMLHFGGIHLPNELLVAEIELLAAKAALKRGRNVVVDDTNLGPLDRWTELGKELGAKVVLRTVTTDHMTAIERYRQREKGSKGLKRFGPLAILFMAMWRSSFGRLV